MLRKLYHLTAIVCIAAMLGGGAFVGYLHSTGKLGDDQIETLVSIVRGETLMSADEEAVADKPTEPAPAPTSAPSRPSEEQVRQQRIETQLRRAGLERAVSDLAAQRELLDHVLADVVQRQESLAADRDEWIAEQQRLQNAADDDGFRRELEILAKLSPKQGKEHLLRTWSERPQDAVRLLNTLPTNVVQRILGEFKNDQEMDVLHQLLARLRNPPVQET